VAKNQVDFFNVASFKTWRDFESGRQSEVTANRNPWAKHKQCFWSDMVSYKIKNISFKSEMLRSGSVSGRSRLVVPKR